MPPDKKDKKFGDKKPAGGSGFDATELIVIGVLILFVGGAIVERLYSFVVTGNLTFYGISLSGAKKSFNDNLPVIRVISYALTMIFAFGTVVFAQLRNTVLATERKRLDLDYVPEAGEPLPEQNAMADRWKQIVAHSESEHPSNWRLAIIAFDI